MKRSNKQLNVPCKGTSSHALGAFNTVFQKPCAPCDAVAESYANFKAWFQAPTGKHSEAWEAFSDCFSNASGVMSGAWEAFKSLFHDATGVESLAHKAFQENNYVHGDSEA